MLSLLNKDINLYKEFLENANVIINAFDVKGRVLIWNKAAEELTGYTRKEALGNPHLMELLYPDPSYRREVLKSIGGSFKDPYKNVEFTLTTKYGDKKCISWSAIAAKDRSGRRAGSFAVGIDVTIKNLVKLRERESFKALLKSVRYCEDIKCQNEEMIVRLKSEVNELCRKAGVPERY